MEVLVVDERPAIRRLLTEALDGLGCRVRAAGSGREALELLRDSCPGAVLLDLKMPGMDGLEVLREIRRLHPALPVVLMTAYGEVGWQEAAAALGVRQYLLKPFSLSDVRQVVHALLEGAAAGDFREEIESGRRTNL
ncbi:MAG: response regulator [Desulfotomaculales bacterium]